MKKFELFAKIFFGFWIAALTMAITFYYYLNQNVLRLKTHYPVWNHKKNTYELVKKRPSSWLSHKLVNSKAKWAIIISEDWAFYEHDGVDLNQLEIVLNEFIETGKLSRGASTITQQVVKNALLSNERSFIRKGVEIILAVLLERNFTKDEILEIYLNLIELGRGIYGIKSASYYYFQKPPSLLSVKEGAFLAMLLPSPKKYSYSFRQKKLTPFASQTVNKILMKLKQAKVITAQEYQVYLEKPLSFEI